MSAKPGGEYDAVTLEAHWPGLSIIAFAVSLLFNYGKAWIWTQQTVVTVAVLCSAGAIAGLLGWHHPSRRQLARAGTILNGMVCLFLATMEMIYRWY